jgi:hypothetical protein
MRYHTKMSPIPEFKNCFKAKHQVGGFGRRWGILEKETKKKHHDANESV